MLSQHCDFTVTVNILDLDGRLRDLHFKRNAFDALRSYPLYILAQTTLRAIFLYMYRVYYYMYHYEKTIIKLLKF